ncbi:hypothetical protein MSHO_16560 [Mycobacterium shottsii]|uniref:Uncharacterized protein n=1 Tax=Mycobacterium shottsii TaxID=133549 RepID=A0A7I7L8A7_9MYCO|nr:hypothetical protein MSHO_16560 [Mycobacterium shottsii]GJO53674.1 hypothetical protein NJB1604_44380 [Mycobacterium marinum]
MQESHPGDLLAKKRVYQGNASVGLGTDKTRDLARQVRLASGRPGIEDPRRPP